MLSLLEFLNQPQRPEQRVRDFVSASKLNLWLRCPLAFRKRYIDGIKTESTPSLSLGRVVHDVLEAIYRCAMVGEYVTENDVPQFVNDAWNRAMASEPCSFDSVEQETKIKNQSIDLVTTYISETDIATERPLAVERKFETPLVDPLTGEDFGITLVGVADLILRNENGPVVVDFKTAATAASNCELQHELQLTAYAYLVRQVFGQESALEIRQLVKTKVPKIVTHCYPARRDEHFVRFFGLVREYLDAFDRGVFNYRPSWNCGMCEHSGACVTPCL
jgi:RecB family exonuclease